MHRRRSSDEGDNDLIHFWTYFVAALRNLQSDIGEAVQGWIDQQRQSQPTPGEPFPTVLLDEIASLPDEFGFVLEDYHVVESQEIHRSLSFLLDHLPPNLHLILSSRADPPLPLSRLRVRNELVELRFTPDEAVQFLNRAMGLNLSAENIAALQARTEGWIAGLQLAALSLQKRADTDQFIASFAGSHRFVLDYLVDEVLQSQSEDIQSFLLETAILDRFTGPLCDAVTGQSGGQRTLEHLEESSLFIQALDDKRERYRYQHLLADVLAVRLQQTEPERMPELHRRATAWLEAQGLTLDAISHALAGLMSTAPPD